MTGFRRLPVRLGLLAGVALLPLAAGCGKGQSSSASASQSAAVSEADFAISAPHHLVAGDVSFRVRNNGPDEHELIIVRTSSGLLPLRSDGVTVNEEALQQAEVDSLSPGKPGAVRSLHVRLSPGRYVLLCNMTGHYMGGMHSTLVVTQ